MTRNDQPRGADERLDQQWDDLVRGRPASDTDPIVRQLHARQSPEPSPLFVSQLRSMIEAAAQEMPARRQITTQAPALSRNLADEPRLLPPLVPARRQPGRMRGVSFAGAIASAVIAVALLIAMVAAVVRYPFGSGKDPENPSTASQGTSIAAPAIPTPSAPMFAPDENLRSVWPFGAGGAGDFTVPAGPDPLRLRLARVELPSAASITILPSAVTSFIPIRGTASITNPAQDGTWQSVPVGSNVSLASIMPTTVANRGDEPVMIHVLAIGTGGAFADATGGADTVMLVDVAIDSLPEGAARYSYESRITLPNMPVIVDASRDSAALLVVDDGAFDVVRDGGTWSIGAVGSPHPSEPTIEEGFPADGQVVLNSGDYAVITSGAAFHGTSANGGEVRFFLLTIEVNSAVVQQAESRAADSTALPPGGTNGSDGTASPDVDSHHRRTR